MQVIELKIICLINQVGNQVYLSSMFDGRWYQWLQIKLMIKQNQGKHDEK